MLKANMKHCFFTDNQHMRELNYGPEKGRHRTSEAGGKNDSSTVGFVLDRGQLGLDAHAWKKVQEKKAVVEKVCVCFVPFYRPCARDVIVHSQPRCAGNVPPYLVSRGMLLTHAFTV